MIRIFARWSSWLACEKTKVSERERYKVHISHADGSKSYPIGNVDLDTNILTTTFWTVPKPQPFACDTSGLAQWLPIWPWWNHPNSKRKPTEKSIISSDGTKSRNDVLPCEQGRQICSLRLSFKQVYARISTTTWIVRLIRSQCQPPPKLSQPLQTRKVCQVFYAIRLKLTALEKLTDYFRTLKEKDCCIAAILSSKRKL